MSHRDQVATEAFDNAVTATLTGLRADGITLADMDDRIGECRDHADGALADAAADAWAYLDQTDVCSGRGLDDYMTHDEVGTVDDVLACVRRNLTPELVMA